MRAGLRGRALPVLFATLLSTGCGVVPRDSHDTLDRVRGGVLRVGVVHHPPWVVVEGARVAGLEPELIERWAGHHGARVAWRPGVEAELVEALHRRELDIVAAGFASDTPYKAKVALTQPYIAVEDRRGAAQRHVLAVMPGESALLLALDRFLASQDPIVLRQRIESNGVPGIRP